MVDALCEIIIHDLSWNLFFMLLRMEFSVSESTADKQSSSRSICGFRMNPLAIDILCF